MRMFRLWLIGAMALCASAATGQVVLPAHPTPEKPAKADVKADAKSRKHGDLPLKPERKLQFTTHEGTWLSVDVSPDGETIVFDLLGDLYTIPIDGGEATRITSGLPFDSQPRFSPDGAWIAYISDASGADNLWIAHADGSDAKALTHYKGGEIASPIWTPDSEYVIVSRVSAGIGGYALWMHHVKGGSGVPLATAPAPSGRPGQPGRGGPQTSKLGAFPSPDGKYLYYAQRPPGGLYNATFPIWQIARRNLTTGDVDRLTQEQGSAMRPVLSPDGRLLVYATRKEANTALRVEDLVTGENRELIYPVQRDDQESRATRDLMPGYAFTPDGESLIVFFNGTIHRVDIATGDAKTIEFVADVDVDLGPRLHFPQTEATGPVRARIIQTPSQSPDGSRIAFSALTRIYTVALPDGEPAQLTRDDERAFQPAWSPDGRSIAYITWTAQGGHLWKKRADGSGRPVRVSRTSAFYSNPVWSPDGSKIVCLRASARERTYAGVDFGSVPGMDLVWFDATGGEANLIAPSRGVGSPHFGPERDRIYVYSNAGLISMRLDGTDRRTHLKITGPGFYSARGPVPADDARISPDGRWALAHARNQLYLIALPHVGGPPPTVNVMAPSMPVKQLTDIGADYFDWADDGETITWAVGASFFRMPMDKVSFEPEKPKANKPADNNENEDAAAEHEDDNGPDADDDDAVDADAEEVETPALYEEFPVVIEVPRHTPQGTIVLRGATVVTMRGEEVIKKADVIVKDNRIVHVGSEGSRAVPDGARIFDVSGKYIVPGFVDTHAHWTEIRRGVLDTQNWSFLANLAYGVTAGLDVQTSTNDMFAYEDLVDAGIILGLRAHSTGPGVFSNNAFKSVDEVKKVLKKYRDYYGTHNIKAYLTGNRKVREWVVEASKELEMMPTTEGALDIKLDMTHAIDGMAGSEHAMPIVPLFDDVVQLFAQSQTSYTPTLLVLYGGPWAENYFYTTEEVHDDVKLNRFMPHNVVDAKSKRRPWFRKDEHAFPRMAAQAAKILRAGGNVGIGSHGQLQGLGYHWEMWALQSGGMTPMETLRVATIGSAKIIGRETEVGSIEPGKFADMVILDKNPLENIRNTNTIRYVMKNGEMFEGDTLRQVWPVMRSLEPLWWWKGDERD